MSDVPQTIHARIRLELGSRCPYDAPDTWWNADEQMPLPASDWAHAAARGVLADLSDRRGIKWQLLEIDEGVRTEMVETLADIIREAARVAGGDLASPARADG